MKPYKTKNNETIDSVINTIGFLRDAQNYNQREMDP